MLISNLIQGKFLDRPNRFVVVFEKDGKSREAHLRDPGRLKELLIPGISLLIRPAENKAHRKTGYDVIAVWKAGIWVVINSGFHSDLAVELIEAGLVPEFSGYTVKKREYTYGKSRIDFLLSGDGGKLSGDEDMLLEVKGCTLVEEGWAEFPDAPTERGKKHVEELIGAKKEGLNSAILFLILREDALLFSPNWKMDADFSEALSRAYDGGVRVVAYSFKNLLDGTNLEIKPFKQIDIKDLV
jgi:sugar fermentation stimulation protein A